jgi:hypothetical protein
VGVSQVGHGQLLSLNRHSPGALNGVRSASSDGAPFALQRRTDRLGGHEHDLRQTVMALAVGWSPGEHGSPGDA